ncbi:MAG: conjugal transfer protein TraB, partial [Aeromonas sp.]
MANINHIVRRKQNVYLLLVTVGLCSVGGVAWYMSTTKSASQKTAKAPPAPPNMTGVVSQTFDKKVSDAAVADIQHTA